MRLPGCYAKDTATTRTFPHPIVPCNVTVFLPNCDSYQARNSLQAERRHSNERTGEALCHSLSGRCVHRPLSPVSYRTQSQNLQLLSPAALKPGYLLPPRFHCPQSKARVRRSLKGNRNRQDID